MWIKLLRAHACFFPGRPEPVGSIVSVGGPKGAALIAAGIAEPAAQTPELDDARVPELREGDDAQLTKSEPRAQDIALFDLAACLPRILSYVAEKRELTPEDRAYAAARLRIMETRARQAELEYAEASGQLHTTASVLSIVGPQHVAFRQKMLGLPTKTARALATITDAVEIQKMLTGEVRRR